jgi:NADH-quinone oxidoreductase subunit J
MKKNPDRFESSPTARASSRWGAIALGALAGLIAQLLPALAAAQEASLTVGGDAAAKGSLGPLVAFYVIGGLTVAGAVATITRRNPVVAAVCLVGTLFASAGLYLLLHATFMAAVQVLVYAGAIMVLFVFVIMAVENPEGEEIGLGRSIGVKLLGVIGAGFLLFRVISVVMNGNEVKRAGAVATDYGTAEAMGKLLFSEYLFPFEAISILLLVAIVGSVVVSRGKRTHTEATEGQGVGGAPGAAVQSPAADVHHG